MPFSFALSGLFIAFFVVLFPSLVSAQSSEPIRSDHLLNVDLLFVGAHPDDESGVAATFAREALDHGAKTAIVLVTRGEGGGNSIGRELGPSLGHLREAELRKSAAVYGVDLIYFLDKTDFFYTLSSRAAFDVWNHDDTLGRLVRLVRLLRPAVIVTMWPGPGTHGMHQAAARLATEAFDAAGDSSRFPEQIEEEFLRPWQPLRLYYNTEHPGAISIPTSDISPTRFMSYAEIKASALRHYRSQGVDRFSTLPPRRAAPESFLLVRTLVPTGRSPHRLLDDLDTPPNPDSLLVSPASDTTLSVSIAPRTDIAEFRRWADVHQVGWAAGLLNAGLSIGAGYTDTLWVQIENRTQTPTHGRVSLTLHASWNKDRPSGAFSVASGKKTRIPYPISVPATTAQGSYRVEARVETGAYAVVDTGHIDVLPALRLSRSVGLIAIDGRLDDWVSVPAETIPATRIWSGELPGGDSDCSGTIRARYDKDYLYVAVEVKDDVVVCNIAPDDIKGHWRSDAVEICVDPSGRSENTLSVFKVGIFPGTTTGPQAEAARDADARQGVIRKTAPGMRVASSFSGDGYRIETAIAWRDLPGGKAPSSGQTIGFNVVLYDGDDTEAGTGVNIGKARLAWSCFPSPQALPYCYGRVFVE
ncbi:MAG: PIG-L family deacetylase [candidate division Zixibacteria bacterium]|nr:PIG-L family deacetylase [candidate division Zixibacteria bacterium]